LLGQNSLLMYNFSLLQLNWVIRLPESFSALIHWCSLCHGTSTNGRTHMNNFEQQLIISVLGGCWRQHQELCTDILSVYQFFWNSFNVVQEFGQLEESQLFSFGFSIERYFDDFMHSHLEVFEKIWMLIIQATDTSWVLSADQIHLINQRCLYFLSHHHKETWQILVPKCHKEIETDWPHSFLFSSSWKVCWRTIEHVFVYWITFYLKIPECV
jgi:hypothetical protein